MWANKDKFSFWAITDELHRVKRKQNNKCLVFLRVFNKIGLRVSKAYLPDELSTFNSLNLNASERE